MKKTSNITAIICGILTTFLVICIVIAAVPAVCRAGESRNEKLEDEAFRELAGEYKASLRDYLEEKGYENAGITLTYVSLKDGERTYTALIHHRRFASLSDAEKDTFSESLEMLGRDLTGCEVCVVYD